MREGSFFLFAARNPHVKITETLRDSILRTRSGHAKLLIFPVMFNDKKED